MANRLLFKGTSTMRFKKRCCVRLLATFTTLAAAGCALTSTKEVTSTPNAPAAIGPYSQAIRVGNTLFLAGQIPLDPQTGQVSSATVEDQTKRVLENINAVLAENGMTMADVVTTTVFLKDLNDFGAMNVVYGTYFTRNPPARTTIQAARLPRDVSIEITATAIK
jgi:2-iminobutanoate/2-iminopropanoate deaminase